MPKKDNSLGPDGIPPILLKKLVEEVSYPLTNIFQTALEPKRLPRDCLTVNISSIYKRDQRVDPIKSRPVCLRVSARGGS